MSEIFTQLENLANKGLQFGLAESAVPIVVKSIEYNLNPIFHWYFAFA